MIVLENNKIKVNIALFGAELTKLYSKETGLDYLWNGNPKFWKRHAPILFPIVGKLKNHTYYVDDKKFYLPQHGFARDNEFSVISQSNNEIIFELSFSEKTLEIYPYRFKLQIGYHLNENILEITYRVINFDNHPLFFSIGAHPAFKCPITNDTSFSDYYVEFQHQEKPLQYSLNKENGLRIEKPTTVELPSKLPLDYTLFEDDALIYKNIKSNVISLQSPKHNHGINFHSSNWEYFAFWTKKDAPFICFEPWMGAADLETTNQDFTTKDGIIELDINKEFKQHYAIEIF
ncbi:aldose 1-epimerase family protein [Tenacibaculum sp. MEBiC06402]|uniref:aldose 1-epimerase family protein n=1 Tax=unclassified Tenacibaculum TaxID=2635139 RepID=UPI003B9C33F7